MNSRKSGEMLPERGRDKHRPCLPMLWNEFPVGKISGKPTAAGNLFHRDRLRQVPWLIDIRALRQGHVVRQQLQRYRVQDR